MVFGHNAKPEADLNPLRKQNSGLSLKGKNKQFTFHSVSVQAKLRNTFLWQGQCMMKKTNQNYHSGIVGGSAQRLVLTWLLQGESPRQSSEHGCTANIGSQCPNELVKIQKRLQKEMKTKQERYPSCVYSTLSGCLLLQGAFFLNLKTVHFQIFFSKRSYFSGGFFF